MLALFLAFLSGTMLPIQAGVNSALRSHLDHPVYASLASYFVGTCALALYALVARLPFPVAGMAKTQTWQWTGGLLGVVYVLLVIILTPKLGPATTFGLVITGQLVASLMLDHFGAFGIAAHHINPQRILGVALLLGGVYLVRNY